ncbi:HAD-IA family hydrolase [Leptospira sp. GIMC2001]|uniref:HAD-IA family hydrolase n=1 Tax=Leptospira sp. GIMC2001 TaxID=1513297 RepID=UPI002349361D|nr:HAD-IA family hydrolase [Leptospira sp. GIMC2001]WCL51066.1 HAD-IA family hydrolase [Leptospira sp. GIMC2001]
MQNHFIYLDIGDTVIHLKKKPGELYLDLFISFGKDLSGIEKGRANESFLNAWKEMDRLYATEDFADRYRKHKNGSIGFWFELIERFCQKLQIQDITNNEKMEIYKTFETKEVWFVEPSFFDLVELSQQRKISLGVLSNWDSRLRIILENLGIFQYFSEMVISGEFGWEKPSPRIFQEAERRAGLSGEKILYTGDKVEMDYRPSQKLGWKSFLFKRQWQLENQTKKGFLDGFEGDIIGKLDEVPGMSMNYIDDKQP